MTDVETFIERAVDAYTLEQFLDIILDDERIAIAVYNLFFELLDAEEDG